MENEKYERTLDGAKLLTWMYENGYFSLTAADMIAEEMEKGTFDKDEAMNRREGTMKLPLAPRPMTCSWEYEKLSYEEKQKHNKCLCWNECPVLQRKREERKANARGFWQRLIAKLF